MDHASPTWLSGLLGKFLVFDGPDGSGKTTQLRRFAGLVQAAGLPLCQVREPGGTVVGEKIRQVLLDPENEGIDLRCEALLFMASRAQLLRERVRPALAAKQVVLADRFVSSTLAYQGAGGGLPKADILAVAQVAVNGTWPDVVVIFDVDEATALERTRGVEKKPRKGRKAEGPVATLFDDRMEQKDQDFRRAVRQSYLDQAAADPARHLLINANAEEDAVHASLLAGLAARFGP